jgi:hypothetical protein
VNLRPLIENTYPLEQIRAAMDQAIRPGTYRIVVAQA